jgi:hypothetical protein
MIRAWRQQPGTLLIAFAVLDALTFAVTRPAAPYARHVPIAGQLAWLAIDGLLAWRVWRGSRGAWAVLLVLTALPLLGSLVAAVSAWYWSWPAYGQALAVIVTAQTMLLISPAIRDHVRAERRKDTEPLPSCR